MTPNLKHTRRSFVSSVAALGAAILSPRKLFAAASASEAGSRADAKLTGFGSSGRLVQRVARRDGPALLDR
jgi:hypothetical protein